jgi:DNA-binding NtrC family response regulator
LLEDDPLVADTVVPLLSAAGHLVTPVDTVAAASALLADRNFDLLISDFHLRDGCATRLLEGLPELAAGLPVILLTASGFVPPAGAAYARLVRAVLPKPAPVETLLGLVQTTPRAGVRRTETSVSLVSLGERERLLDLL